MRDTAKLGAKLLSKYKPGSVEADLAELADRVWRRQQRLSIATNPDAKITWSRRNGRASVSSSPRPKPRKRTGKR